MCSLGQVVKTSPSHGGIRGSTPLGSTKRKISVAFASEIFIFIHYALEFLALRFFQNAKCIKIISKQGFS